MPNELRYAPYRSRPPAFLNLSAVDDCGIVFCVIKVLLQSLNCNAMASLVHLCNLIVSRSLEQSRLAIFGSYYTLCGLNVICAAIAAALMLALPSKPSWPPHRAFLSLVLVGSCLGAAAAFFRMHQVFYGTSASKNYEEADYLRIDAQSDWNGAWFYLLTPWETACLLFAKLLVLDRMRTFAHRFGSSGPSHMSRWSGFNSRRPYFATIILLLLIGFCSYSAGAGLYFQSSAMKSASLALNMSDAMVKAAVYADAAVIYNKSRLCLSVHDFSESFMLLIIIAAFCIVGFHIKQRVQSVLGKLPALSYKVTQDAHEEGTRINRRITAAVVSIFISFLLRFAWILANAIAALAVKDPSCESECAACQSSGYVLSKIMFLAGEIRAVWGILSNPLALTISIVAMHERRSGYASASASSTAPLIRRGS
jgi:hypothetical protein